jgi:hypothetical protein
MIRRCRKSHTLNDVVFRAIILLWVKQSSIVFRAFLSAAPVEAPETKKQSSKPAQHGGNKCHENFLDDNL